MKDIHHAPVTLFDVLFYDEELVALTDNTRFASLRWSLDFVNGGTVNLNWTCPKCFHDVILANPFINNTAICSHCKTRLIINWDKQKQELECLLKDHPYYYLIPTTQE